MSTASQQSSSTPPSQSQRVRVIAEMGLTLALFAVLQFVNVRLPINIMGGTISFAMVPIVIFALRRGALAGVAAGALCGVLDLAIEPYIVHPAQLVLDYPLAFALVGLSGLLAPFAKRALESSTAQVGSLTSVNAISKVALIAVAAALIGGLARFCSHLVSGIIFFGANGVELGQSAFVYSLLYNASYMVPSIIATCLIAAVVYPLLARALK